MRFAIVAEWGNEGPRKYVIVPPERHLFVSFGQGLAQALFIHTGATAHRTLVTMLQMTTSLWAWQKLIRSERAKTYIIEDA